MRTALATLAVWLRNKRKDTRDGSSFLLALGRFFVPDLGPFTTSNTQSHRYRHFSDRAILRRRRVRIHQKADCRDVEMSGHSRAPMRASEPGLMVTDHRRRWTMACGSKRPKSIALVCAALAAVLILLTAQSHSVAQPRSKTDATSPKFFKICKDQTYAL